MLNAADIPVGKIINHALNPRDDLGDLDELAAELDARGMLDPVLVFEHPKEPGQYVLIDGERRWRAARQAGHPTVPAVIRPVPKTEAGTLLDMLATVLHRKDLTPVELAQAFGKLRDDYGLTLQQIADRAGKAQSTVSYHLGLLLLTEDSRDRLAAGQISAKDAHDAIGRGRRQAKARGDLPPARGTIKAEPPHLAWRHELAADVANRCGLRHLNRPKVGPGCGQCWEITIRIDQGGDPAKAEAYVEGMAARAGSRP